MDMKSMEKQIYDGDPNLIPKKDVSLIKIKLGKSHRKESDWAIIKEILTKHNVIVVEPKEPDPGIKVIKHVICRNRFLYIFTNVEDCMRFVYMINIEDNKVGREFFVGSMPFESCVDIAKSKGLPMYIDNTYGENDRCMLYMPEDGSIKAVVTQKVY